MLLFCTADCKFLRVLLRLLAAEVVLVVLEVFVAVVVPFKLPVGEEPVDVELEVLFVMVELDVPLLELFGSALLFLAAILSDHLYLSILSLFSVPNWQYISPTG